MIVVEVFNQRPRLLSSVLCAAVWHLQKTAQQAHDFYRKPVGYPGRCERIEKHHYNIRREMIFTLLEQYTEDVIFVLFFTLSAMHLDFSVLASNYIAIIIHEIIGPILSKPSLKKAGEIKK